MKIFITLGSQKFQFNRLIEAVDKQIIEGKINDCVFAQIGASDYQPKSFEFKNYIDRDEYAERIGKADIVITHGGTGAIIGAIKKGKRVIAIPRLSKYNEHVDDHQIQLISQFKELNLISECQNCDEIWKIIEEVKDKEFNIYRSNTSKIIKNIEKYINVFQREGK